MKLTNKEEMSQWAYFQCKYGNDTPEMRNLITDSYWAYWYCRFVKDKKEMWKKIKDSDSATKYCINVSCREELFKYICDKDDIIKLCTTKREYSHLFENKLKTSNSAYMFSKKTRYKSDKLVSMIKGSKYSSLYCIYVEDDDRLWPNINTSGAALNYCLKVKDRPEVRKIMG